MSRSALVLAALLVACSTDHAAIAGVMLEISAPSALKESAVSLRVRMSSGQPDGELVERGDETVDVAGWPAEVFVRAEDVSRVWSADVWALDEDDEVVGSVSATGVFRAGEVPVAPLYLDPVTEQEADDAGKRDGGVTTRDAGMSNGDANDGVLIIPMKPDTGTTATDASAPGQRDSSAPMPKPVDAATPQPVPDAGPAPGPNMCAAAPAYATTTACSKCACSKCGTEVTACYTSSEAAKNTQCGAIEACAETSKCTGEGCFCGSSPTCLFPDGACRMQIQTAAGSDNLLDVQAARDDANSSTARAFAIDACRLSNCKSECGL